MNAQSLRDFEQFQKTLRCFDWLRDTHATGGMDLDLCLERHGRVLILEGKPRLGPKVLVGVGQLLTLRALATQPGITVLLVAEDQEAKTGEGLAQYSVLRITPESRPHAQDGSTCIFYTDNNFKHVDLAGLQRIVNDWWGAGTQDP